MIVLQKRKLEVVGQGMTTTLYSTDDDVPRQVLDMCQHCHSMNLVREKSTASHGLNKSFRSKCIHIDTGIDNTFT